MTLAFKTATQTIPIVTIIGDPVALGLASSLARPGVNVTGITVDAGIELHGKRLSLLNEMRRGATHLGYIASSAEGFCSSGAGRGASIALLKAGANLFGTTSRDRPGRQNRHLSPRPARSPAHEPNDILRRELDAQCRS